VVVTDPCKTCRGAGKVRREKTLEVKIPPGVDTGDRIRLTGEGEPGGPGAPPGDLYVQINVKPHDFFEREGSDLFCTVPISLVTATLGGDQQIPTLSGRDTLHIPDGTQNGKQFKLRGKGVKSVRGGPVGDLICTVLVETPVKLNKHQKELLRQFHDSLAGEGGRNTPATESWLNKAKKFFDQA
jgi:molecular chaperone DnaJ